MKSFTTYLNEQLLDESLIKAAREYINQDILKPTNKEEFNHNGISVTKLDANESNRKRFKPDFEPTHMIKIHGVEHVVGKELGRTGNVIYRKEPNGSHVEVSGFRLLHEHPTLIAVKLGHSIYADHKEAFRAMPITGTKKQLGAVMKLDPSSRVGGVSATSMQMIALKHKNAGGHLVSAALESPHNINPIIFKKAITMHGLTRQQATGITHNSHLMSHRYIATTAHDRLTRP